MIMESKSKENQRWRGPWEGQDEDENHNEHHDQDEEQNHSPKAEDNSSASGLVLEFESKCRPSERTRQLQASTPRTTPRTPMSHSLQTDSQRSTQ